jgi:TonB family protein
MLELSQRRTANGPAGKAPGQPRKLLLALVLLLVALVAVLVKDRDFWFGSASATIESDMEAPQTASQAAPKSQAREAKALSASAAKKQIPASKVSVEQQPVDAPVAVKRTVLPPLDVEVVAGDKHSRVRPGSRITRVEIPNTPSISTDSAAELATNAVEKESIAVQPAQSSSYPLLAQHMNVQGSVILQALIGPDGVIENLRVLSGPAILAAAAQQAVREWRFKPIMQHGQAVESKAQITVNFSIKIADNSAKTTLAESRISDTLIITR